MKNGLALCAVVLFLPSVAFGQSSALQLTQRIALPNVDGRMDHMGVDIAGQRLFPSMSRTRRRSRSPTSPPARRSRTGRSAARTISRWRSMKPIIG